MVLYLPAYFPGLEYVNQNQRLSIYFRHLIWISALLWWNNKSQAILSICKTPTPSPTSAINVAEKTSWREIPLVNSSIVFFNDIWHFSSTALTLLEYVPILDHVQSTSQYSLPETSVNSFSRKHFISLAPSKSIFCSLASRVILLQERCATLKENRQKKTEEELLKR